MGTAVVHTTVTMDVALPRTVTVRVLSEQRYPDYDCLAGHVVIQPFRASCATVRASVVAVSGPSTIYDEPAGTRASLAYPRNRRTAPSSSPALAMSSPPTDVFAIR